MEKYFENLNNFLGRTVNIDFLIGIMYYFKFTYNIYVL